MKLIRENSRLIFLPERDSTYSIELPEGTMLQGEGKQPLPETNQIHPIYQVSFDRETCYLAEQLVSEVHITTSAISADTVGQTADRSDTAASIEAHLLPFPARQTGRPSASFI